jgi:hypothetical protein
MGVILHRPVQVLLPPVKPAKMPRVVFGTPVDIGRPVSKPGPDIEEKADDRNDCAEQAGGHRQLEQEIRSVWFVHNHSLATRK